MTNKNSLQREVSISNNWLLSAKILRDTACRNISANVWEIIEERLLMKRVILDRLNTNLLNLKQKRSINTFDMWWIELNIDEEEQKQIRPYLDENIVIWEIRIEKITINWKEDNIYFFPMTIKWIKFSLISIPNWMKQMKLSQTYVWKQLEKIDNLDCLPYYDLKEITIWEVTPHFIIIWTNHLKDSNEKTIINKPLISSDFSMLKELAIKWFVSNPIIESIILVEIIKNRFWIDYINYPWRAWDSDEIWYENVRKKIENICEFLWINDPELTIYTNSEKNETSVAIKSLAPYKNKKWNIKWVAVWDCTEWLANQFPNTWTLWSIFSLDLNYGAWVFIDPYWIRPSLWLY